VKLNSSGTELLYSTYLGGASHDRCAGIAVDSVGNAHVAGHTYSDDFPTSPSAFQVNARAGNSFVSKLNATGTAMLYSTRFGSALDAAQTYSVGGTIAAIALDLDGNAYLTGFTSSSDFPTTPGAFQSVCNSTGSDYWELADAFVTKLNATGTELLYSTCLGGRNFEEGVAITVDLAGNAYVAGRTGSADFPTTPGDFQTGPEVETWGGAFVTKLNSAGSALVYSTYLGDQLWVDDIGVDFVGDAYVSGARSDSTGSHAFVTKLHDDLSLPAPLESPTEVERHARQETLRGLKADLQMSK
jgi:DNA-binding beta-propeller fold protein YncE